MNRRDYPSGAGGVMQPTLPDVLAFFVRYRRKHGAEWGPLHVILADGNVRDTFLPDALADAIHTDDRETVRAVCILGLLSQTQRRKLPYMVEDALTAEVE
jgi:hypothetical protein